MNLDQIGIIYGHETVIRRRFDYSYSSLIHMMLKSKLKWQSKTVKKKLTGRMACHSKLINLHILYLSESTPLCQMQL
jgi:hypothetical protein